MKENLVEEILGVVTNEPGIKAKVIGIKLGIDKSIVNSVLHSSLKGKVIQDKAYRWWPYSPSSAGGHPQAAETTKLNTPLAQLCGYYLDCLSHDDQGGISLFASSQFEPDYIELLTLPLIEESSSDLFDFENPKKMLNRIRRERNRMTLMLGYPVLLTHIHARSGWEGFKVEPVFLYGFAEDPNYRNALPKLSDDPPHINFSALRSMTGGEVTNIIEEAVYLSEELGLANAPSEQPDVDELTARIRAIRPEWNWKEEPDSKNLGTETPLRELREPGVYNRAVLLITERSHYTQGLETELTKLQSVEETSYMNTSLRSWLEGNITPDHSGDSQPLLELLPLNSEQRQGVQQSLNSQLTAITGPPGTGKSQVVASILINATWQGKTVLFASKNNKAVDVVETRVNALGPRPVLLRMGANGYQAKLAEYLISLLAASATPSDQAQFEEAATAHEKLRMRFNQLEAKIAEIIRLRNDVDQLEQIIEPIRAALGEKAFCSFRGIDLKPCEANFDELQESIKRASRKEQPLVVRIIWPLVRKDRFRELREVSIRFRTTADKLWLALPQSELSDLTISEWERLISDTKARIYEASQVKDYFQRLAELSVAAPLEQSAEEKTRLAEEMEETSSLIWDKWLRLQPKRLSQKERAIINEYCSLLKMIVAASDSGQKLGSHVFHKYHQLFPELINILPCWAITSLSARGRLPFVPGFFDLLVIDEASQCDIASAIPLLFRAKRVVIIGDPKQLRHVSSLPTRLDRQLLEKHDLVDKRASWAYSVNSAFDLASGQCRSEDIVSLRDHHRSHSDIIEFSNQHFYEGRLRVATRYDKLRFLNKDGPAIRWIDIRGRVKRPSSGGAINEEEAKAVVAELERLVIKQNYLGSIGVVSPFRMQFQRINELVRLNDNLQSRLIERDFLAYTAHGFQGDERDLMIFSPVVSEDTPSGALGFLKNNPNLFNVAITRARSSLIVVGDKQAAADSKVDFLSRFAEYVATLGRDRPRYSGEARDLGEMYPKVARPELVSNWEKVFYRILYRAGLRPIPQYEVEKYALDLAIIDGERRLDIEVDGEHYHKNWDGELSLRDQIRNQRLIELGWDVMRFWVYQIRDDMDACVSRVKKWR